MSLELGQPADGDQAVSADEAEETRSPEETTLPSSPAASDATSTYDADSDVPDDARYSDDADDSDEPDTTETADTSDAPDAADTSNVADTPDAPDGIDTVDAWDAAEDSGAADAPDTADPDTPGTADVYEPSDDEASDAEPLADPGAPGTAEPSVLDDATDAPATGASIVPADEEAADEETLPVSGASTPGAPVGSAAQLEEAAGDLDGPLLGDAASLRTNCQQILAGFVDDPREAVADAAGLVDHTAQALVGALQARQRLLRAMWDRDASADDLGTPGIGSPTGAHAAGASRADGALGTEELRLLIQRYRTLFNDICPS